MKIYSLIIDIIACLSAMATIYFVITHEQLSAIQATGIVIIALQLKILHKKKP